MAVQLTCSVLTIFVIISPALAMYFSVLEKRAIENPRKFPTDIAFYDTNNDDLVDYEEFCFAVMTHFNLIDPTELRAAFKDADKDGDEKLNKLDIQSLDITVNEEGTERGFDLQAREENRLERRGCSMRCSTWPPRCRLKCGF